MSDWTEPRIPVQEQQWYSWCVLLEMILQLHHSPPPLPPALSNSSCQVTRCQPLCASCCTVLLYFSQYSTVRWKMSPLFLVCSLCIISVKSIVSILQYSTIQPTVLVGYLRLKWLSISIKLFLLDLHACSQNGTCLHVRDLLYSLLPPPSFSSKILHCNAIHQKERVIMSLRASLWRTIISWKEMCKEVCRLLLLDTPPITSWVCSFRSDCYPMDCSLPDPSVSGILQVRILEWAAIFFIEIY